MILRTCEGFSNPQLRSTTRTMTKLYGGAISCDLPEVAVDVSDFREVPDTQEVFILERPDGLDRSVIIDLLEMVKANSLPEIISIHLEDIVDGVPQFLAPIESSTHPEGFDVHHFLVKPPPSKQETEGVKLFVLICLVRLEKVESDVVFTFNVPLKCGEITPEEFQAQVQNITNSEGELGHCFQQLKHWAATFTVQDWNLFS